MACRGEYRNDDNFSISGGLGVGARVKPNDQEKADRLLWELDVILDSLSQIKRSLDSLDNTPIRTIDKQEISRAIFKLEQIYKSLV